MRRVLACGATVVVRGVPDGKFGVVVHVGVSRLSGQERYGARRGYRDSNQSERKSEMGVGGRQVIGTTAAGHLSRLWTALEAEELEAVLIEWAGRWRESAAG